MAHVGRKCVPAEPMKPRSPRPESRGFVADVTGTETMSELARLRAELERERCVRMQHEATLNRCNEELTKLRSAQFSMDSRLAEAEKRSAMQSLLYFAADGSMGSASHTRSGAESRGVSTPRSKDGRVEDAAPEVIAAKTCSALSALTVRGREALDGNGAVASAKAALDGPSCVDALAGHNRQIQELAHNLDEMRDVLSNVPPKVQLESSLDTAEGERRQSELAKRCAEIEGSMRLMSGQMTQLEKLLVGPTDVDTQKTSANESAVSLHNLSVDAGTSSVAQSSRSSRGQSPTACVPSCIPSGGAGPHCHVDRRVPSDISRASSKSPSHTKAAVPLVTRPSPAQYLRSSRTTTPEPGQAMYPFCAPPSSGRCTPRALSPTPSTVVQPCGTPRMTTRTPRESPVPPVVSLPLASIGIAATMGGMRPHPPAPQAQCQLGRTGYATSTNAPRAAQQPCNAHVPYHSSGLAPALSGGHTPVRHHGGSAGAATAVSPQFAVCMPPGTSCTGPVSSYGAAVRGPIQIGNGGCFCSPGAQMSLSTTPRGHVHHVPRQSTPVGRVGDVPLRALTPRATTPRPTTPRATTPRTTTGCGSGRGIIHAA
eukprot:TRINITY_DN61085_c0_g1_i1.p1 TRINITY_DN61085_c0_g1~~TRINITY_DN61085_c0_g1_i1.p1  ORF type:complete len:686 (+),score=84.52 TRINITY_DN61085_c0_g1_i1:265-2058(+)